jgi:hypothetical protein
MTTISQVQISNQFSCGSDFVCIDFCDQLLTENSDYIERNFHHEGEDVCFVFGGEFFQEFDPFEGIVVDVLVIGAFHH